ncbi:MAG: Rid family detoxifying hydrolase [Planctomycetota bacterium]
MCKIQSIQPVAQVVIGPYSPAVVVGDMVYVSGQIPRTSTGKVIGDSIETATICALDNLRAVLAAADCSPADVVKTTVFMQDLTDFEGMNTVYATFFGAHRPARSTVQVAKLPAGARVEIDCIAVRQKPSDKRRPLRRH